MNDRIPSNMTMGKSSRPGIFYSLRSKMLFYFMFLFIVILLVMKIVEIYGIPFTRIQGEYKIRRSEVLMNLNLMADLKKERIVRWLKKRRDDARVIARSPLIQTHIVKINQVMHDFESEGGDKQTIPDYIQKENYQDLIEHFNLIINSYGVYHNIQVVELHGSNIIVSTDSNYLGSSIVLSDAIRKKLADNEVSMNFIVDPQTKDLDLYIYHSILETGDKTIPGEKNAFILVLHVHTEDLFIPMLYSGAGLGKTGEIVLVNKEVKIITPLKHALPDGQIAKPLEYRINAKPALLASRGEEGLIITKDYRGEPVLAAFRYIPITSEDGWGMVVKQDMTEIFRPIRQSIIFTSIIGLFGIIFVLITVYTVAENLSRPIRKLSATAKTIEAGDLLIAMGTREQLAALEEICQRCKPDE